MGLTIPVRTSSYTSQLSRPPLLTMTLRVPPTLHHPFGMQDWRASSSRSGNGLQRALPTQTRASAFAIAAAIIFAVSLTADMALPAYQALHAGD